MRKKFIRFIAKEENKRDLGLLFRYMEFRKVTGLPMQILGFESSGEHVFSINLDNFKALTKQDIWPDVKEYIKKHNIAIVYRNMNKNITKKIF